MGIQVTFNNLISIITNVISMHQYNRITHSAQNSFFIQILLLVLLIFYFTVSVVLESSSYTEHHMKKEC